MRGGEQPAHLAFVGIGALVGEEGGGFLRRGRQSGQVEPQSTQQSFTIRFSGKLQSVLLQSLQQAGAGPFIAIRMQLITRKSLGGLRTDLSSRVLDADGAAVPGLYCVGEAAGFGGGGSNGKRSLEGTFLPGCILTAHAAVRSLRGGG